MKNKDDTYVLAWLAGVMETTKKNSIFHRMGWLKQPKSYITAKSLHHDISEKGLQVNVEDAIRIVFKELY